MLFFVVFFCASDQIIQAYLQDITDPAQHLQSDPAAAMLDITQVLLASSSTTRIFSFAIGISSPFMQVFVVFAALPGVLAVSYSSIIRDSYDKIKKEV